MNLHDSSKSSIRDEPSNPNYESDIKRTLKHTRWLLKCLGVWPMISKNSSPTWKCASKLLIIMWLMILAILIVPATLHVVSKETDLNVRITLLGPIGYWITNLLKYVLIVYHWEPIKMCIEHVKDDWKRCDGEKNRSIMTSNEKVGRRLTIVCGTFLYAGGFSYSAIMPMWSAGQATNEKNETVRPLVYPRLDSFIDVRSTPKYEIHFCAVLCIVMIAYSVTTAACNLAAVFVSHTCGQMKIVISRLDTLVDGVGVDVPNDRDIQKHITLIVKCHVRILKFSAVVERILQDICLVEVVASTLIICLLEYYCMTEWNNSDTVSIITYLLLLVSLSFNIFIFCHIGELLKEQCREVGNAAYMIDWYRLPGKKVLALVMIIAMADYPRRLTAGGMIEMSIASFGHILKTSLAYLNMLRTIAD